MDQRKLSPSLRQSCVYGDNLSSVGPLVEAQSQSWLNMCPADVLGRHMLRRKCR